ncbi:MAG: methyltransferase [Nitrospirales bacterium]|nr:MAG: methyltransferase [Nitrospirales bacterium]
MKNSQSCRFCGTVLEHTFLDLGTSPFSNSYVKAECLGEMEPFFPLYAFVCSRCLLVQLKDCSSPERIFSDYAYFSSYSDLWLQHVRVYTDMIQERIKLDERSLVVEVASNDGYLLQYFVKKGIPVLGIEPAENVAKVATEKGISTRVSFFGERSAQCLVEEGKQADLLIGNNVLAHVPDLNDFVRGLQTLLKPQGVITMEFPHVMRLMEENQFDTIYHEHFSYFSFVTVEQVFRSHGLILFDVEELPTHGGSLRIYARHEADHSKLVESRVAALQDREKKAGLQTLEHYLSFAEKVHHTKRQLLSFLIEAKEKGKTIVGYGAPAKGNTLLNYCGIRTDFIDYTVDRSPHKQGLYLPGTHIPIHDPDAIRETKPDYVLILPWNLKDEIMQQMACIRDWGGAFVVPIPEVRVYP